MFISKPDTSGPEASGPFYIFSRLKKAVKGVGRLEAVSKLSQTVADNANGAVHSRTAHRIIRSWILFNRGKGLRHNNLLS